MLGAGTAGKLSQAMVKDVAGACHDLVLNCIIKR